MNVLNVYGAQLAYGDKSILFQLFTDYLIIISNWKPFQTTATFVKNISMESTRMFSLKV